MNSHWGTRLLTLIICAVALQAHAEAHSERLKLIFDTPDKQPADYRINVAGSFNEWQMNTASQMNWDESEKRYQYSVPKGQSYISFNYYKNGDFQNPLATRFGKPNTCGFILPPDTQSSFKPDFYGWAKDPSKTPPETIVGKLITLTDFPMPELNRSGDIYIHLPESYQESFNKRYPVVYMLDGQNLFSESAAYSDEWQVDETVIAAQMDIIVVGIANGPERWKEYNPWDAVNYRGEKIKGQGENTIGFIEKSLKPYIDSTYRTLTSVDHTALMGSSLGGLMALYGAIEHSQTFGKVAAFSPSFSFATTEGQLFLMPVQSNLINAAKKASPTPGLKLYFDVGEVEYGSFILLDSLHNALLSAGFDSSQLHMVQDKLGRHCELDWSKRLPGALQWLFRE
ncbi:alpha/beta hydrolase [Planctobacterium marinum]|uniref:alpha/beta hydrolase n=1 Tax=Planctobacterium marinum TaxID=1631968 RepID=UPI001E389E01|nr:alpha/beta hydrolase-fold protein [Planctobacterium marinum]MCC2607527.1 hypothetical protein [Planctobacterium marinum]